MYFKLFAERTIYPFCVISSFRPEGDGYCTLLGHYAASSGNILPTDCPETPVRNFTTTRYVITPNSAVLQIHCFVIMSVLWYSSYWWSVGKQSILLLYKQHNCTLPRILLDVAYGRRHVVINLLQTKRRPLYLKTQSVPRCKHFLSRL